MLSGWTWAPQIQRRCSTIWRWGRWSPWRRDPRWSTTQPFLQLVYISIIAMLRVCFILGSGGHHEHGAKRAMSGSWLYSHRVVALYMARVVFQGETNNEAGTFLSHGGVFVRAAPTVRRVRCWWYRYTHGCCPSRDRDQRTHVLCPRLLWCDRYGYRSNWPLWWRRRLRRGDQPRRRADRCRVPQDRRLVRYGQGEHRHRHGQ